MLKEDDVARLLPTQHSPGSPQLLQDVAVPDLGLDHRDSQLAHGQFETEVAHHGGHDGVERQCACRLPMRGTDRHDGVSVHLGPGLVDSQHAIGVTVVRDAEVDVVGSDDLGQRTRGSWSRNPR